MRELVAEVYASSSESTRQYLRLIRRAQDDEEARRSAMHSVDSDLPRWFLVVMAPGLKPVAAIGGRLLVLPRILEAIGWAAADAEALLLGDPLAPLAREIGLEAIGTQLEEAGIRGWLPLNRISDLKSKFNLVLSNPKQLGPAGTKATAGYWVGDEAQTLATQLVQNAQRVLAIAEARNRPLRIVFDF